MPKIFDLIFSQKLVDLMDDDLYNSFQPGKAKSIRPSLLGGCLRNLVLNMIRFPPKPNKKDIIKTLRNYEDGISRHLKWRDKFQKKGNLVVYEKELPLEDGANGRIDYIIKRDVSPFDETPVELKGVGSKYWSKIPYKKDIIQLTYYCMRLNKSYGLLIYENKDTLEPREFTIVIDDYKDEVTRRLSLVNLCLKSDKLPDKEYKAGDFRCRNCVWKRLYCWT